MRLRYHGGMRWLVYINLALSLYGTFILREGHWRWMSRSVVAYDSILVLSGVSLLVLVAMRFPKPKRRQPQDWKDWTALSLSLVPLWFTLLPHVQ